ncbi:MAG: peptidoglycan DD-metalloendopeptidase family protein [Nitratireductor sp.]
MKLDYKDSYQSQRQQPSRRPQPTQQQTKFISNLPHILKSWRLHTFIIVSACISSFIFLFESEKSEASAPLEHTNSLSTQSFSEQASQLNRFDLNLPGQNIIQRQENPVSAPQQPSKNKALKESAWQSAKVKPGDSLARIAYRHEIASVDIHNLMQTGEDTQVLTRIKPGEEIRFVKNPQGQLKELEYDITETERLHITRSGNDFTSSIIDRPFEVIENRRSAVIDNSLYEAAKSSGLSDNVIMEMANIYGYDIDFALDIRKGDRFTVIWEEYYRDGEKIQDGDIVATEFVNNNRTIRAVKYTDDTGKSDYYTPDGKSLRKAFLRSPVHFTRISSKFNPNRLHPIFKTKRPHRGVDYAAKTGTPIYSAGDGKVIHRGKKGGYGNTVIIQHGNKYNTLYAHMSSYNRKVRNGSRVKQGQVIGYVGSTGWATGPHLHYEFRINGVHRNPLTVKLPSAEPLAKKYRDDFALAIKPLMSQLDILGKTQLASFDQ